jgi:hypothetical protein
VSAAPSYADSVRKGAALLSRTLRLGVSALLAPAVLSVVAGADAARVAPPRHPPVQLQLSTDPAVLRARYKHGLELFSYDRRQPLHLSVSRLLEPTGVPRFLGGRGEGDTAGVCGAARFRQEPKRGASVRRRFTVA